MKEKKVSGESTSEEPGSHSATLNCHDNWHVARKTSVQTIEHLTLHVSLDTKEKRMLQNVISLYRMRIPHYYFSLIADRSDRSDPIRRQCVPSVEEIQGSKYEKIDPLAEEKTSPIPCLVHRYPDRVLLLVTGQCFMYCRHCTRKRLWWSKQAEPTLKDINLALSYVRSHKEIREVVISGGDPLTLATERLDYILSRISRIASVEAIRIGTRAPVVLPQRIDDQLCMMLERFSNLWINVQFNHPREITPEAIAACRKIQKCGIVLSNQTVLLKGINDDPAVMMRLCQKLQSIRIRPYYLFQCDPVVGANHFRTSVYRGIEIIEKMRGHTSGMCIPTFVVDGTDGKGKIPLNPNYIVSMTPTSLTLRNYNHECFAYESPSE